MKHLSKIQNTNSLTKTQFNKIGSFEILRRTDIEVDRLIDVKRVPTAKEMIETFGKADTRNVFAATIAIYVKENEVLDLTPMNCRQIAKRICEEYNERTDEGGYQALTVLDVHQMFQMGLEGRFGKSYGKFQLQDICGIDGWLEKYWRYRNEEMQDYFYQKNRAKKIDETKKYTKCPKEFSVKRLVDKKRKESAKEFRYESLESYSRANALDFAELKTKLDTICRSDYKMLSEGFKITYEVYWISFVNNFLEIESRKLNKNQKIK